MMDTSIVYEYTSWTGEPTPAVCIIRSRGGERSRFHVGYYWQHDLTPASQRRLTAVLVGMGAEFSQHSNGGAWDSSPAAST